MTEFDFIIVGGGVAGGSLAVALSHLQSDARILLVEQTARSGAINRGDYINPRSLGLLETWGVKAEMEARGAIPFRYNELYDHRGRLLMRHDYRFYRAPLEHGLALEHPQIEESLLTVAARNPNLTIWRSTRFEGIAEHDADGVALKLLREGEAVTVRGRWAVAADGRTSRLREEAGIRTEMKPYPYEFFVTQIPLQERWRDTSAQFLGPHGFLGIFNVNGPHNRLVLSLPVGSFAEFMKRPEAERYAEVVRRAPLLESVPVLWDQAHCYRLFEHHSPAYFQGRVILIGDTAHTFTPMLGMGMNLAIEDAETLASLLAHRPQRERLDPSTLKREYEAVRRPRNERIKVSSTRQGHAQVAGGRLTIFLTQQLMRLLHRLPLLRERLLYATFH